MFYNPEVISWPKVVTTASLSRSEIEDLQKAGWWRPTRGVLAEPIPDGIHPSSPQAHQHVHLAHVLAVAETSPDDSVLAGPTASMLLGHPLWPPVSDVFVYRDKGRRTLRELGLPPTTPAPTPTPTPNPICYRPMIPVPQLDQILEVNGIALTSLERTAVDVARLAGSESAFITVCSILGRLASSGSNYRDRKTYRKDFLLREAAARAQILTIVDKLPRVSGRARARQIIMRAEGLLESVAEARFLWFIHAYGFPVPELQCRFDLEGHEFFTDFTWHERKVVVEFNGEAKYGTGAERERKVAEERARESLLRLAGYRVLNLSWRQLNDPQSLSRLIDRFLNSPAQGTREGSTGRRHPAKADRSFTQKTRPVRRDSKLA